MYKNKYKYKILWVDDDSFCIKQFAIPFFVNDFKLSIAIDADQAMNLLKKHKGEFDLIILDVRLPSSKILPPVITQSGFKTGIALASLINNKYPNIPIMGFSIYHEKDIKYWFTSNNHFYTRKDNDMSAEEFFAIVESIIRKKKGPFRKPNMFIVHGHDERTKLELKNYLQNTLNLGEPIILHEKPNYGRTIIEKFEGETDKIDIVFVILTPDDIINQNNHIKRRTRQNVIFELGYFYGRMKRQSGKIILLYKDEIEFPSDIFGISYINISEGIFKAGENIRSELKEWLVV